MSDVQRTLEDARSAFKCSKNPHSYDQWADTYITDHTIMGYKGPYVTTEVLMKYFTLQPEKVRVLDLACGTGWVAQQLSALGFRSFVGVDGSQPMLDKAKESKLYDELHLTLLGKEPLKVTPGTFEVVTMVGALHRKFVPPKVVRELCDAAKPGGLVVMTQVVYEADASFTLELEEEMRLMEEEGLWQKLEKRRVEDYLLDPYQPEGWAAGSVYIYQKTP